MPHGISGIDHVLVGVRDLDQASLAWERLGFTLTPRGRHIGWGTANACIMFERDFVELIGIADAREFTNNLESFLERRQGLMGVAWASADSVASAASLKAAGLEPSEPRELGRQMELPQESVVARFKLVHLPEAATPAIPSFVCQHLTPGIIRQPAWLKHANGAVGLKGITIVAEDPPALNHAYDRLFGAHNVTRTDNVLTLHAGRHALVLATRDDLSALQPDLSEDEIPPAPAIVLMTLLSEDLDRTADHLTRWQVEHEQHGRLSIIVPPDMATGVAIEFVAA
ncbi:MAG TPA: VOC family protein [Aliidongia sp.]|nr:VOC family protein [Aliidongia sp.]